jgi:hypothetical protein
VSPSEIGFLALGITLGITAGVALLAVVRPRSPFRPVVRVTVTPNAIVPRGRGEAGRPRPTSPIEPAPGSPDEDARLDLADGLPVGIAPAPGSSPSPAAGFRTRVPSDPATVPSRAVGIPILGNGQPATGPLASARSPIAVAEPSAREAAPPLPTRLDVGTSRPELGVRPRLPVPEARPKLAPNSIAVPIVAGRAPSGGRRAAAGAGKPASRTDAPATAADPCADDRTRAASACAAADAARDAARGMADRLREAQRSHTDLQARVEEAGALADPRRLAAEKERLHAQFKAAHGATASPDEAEAAAREWLTAVSAANTASRDAARRVQAGTDELRAQAGALERLELEASAARISAERAEEACRTAREQLAACEERQRPAPEPAGEPEEGGDPWPAGAEPGLDQHPRVPAEQERLPVILRVLAGDVAAREQLVASLAAGDPSATAAWHVRIASFVDAVTARAIEDGFLDVSDEDPFWRLFSSEEQREIVLALSALGFRFDGMHGFADDRVPSARDLSLAVGYAGLDRMRIRTWPGEAALAALFEDATVRADLWLATEADDLSLSHVEASLGARAAGLAELWDAWGLVRPAMLDER